MDGRFTDFCFSEHENSVRLLFTLEVDIVLSLDTISLLDADTPLELLEKDLFLSRQTEFGRG